MTVIALDLAVSPSKSEVGVLLVVKLSASMDVIQAMARNTRAWGMFVALIRVAGSAGNLAVFSL